MTILCHYDEIGIKGKNRNFFEKKLAENITKNFKKYAPEIFLKTKRIYGRILVFLKNNQAENEKKASEILSRTFGIANFAFILEASLGLEAIKKTCLEIAQKQPNAKTFRVSAKRANKSFPVSSQEINIKIGAFIEEKANLKVDLINYDINFLIDIADQKALLYTKKIPGPGGMPVGSSSKALALVSGGIDSPVAAYYALKRGVKPHFIHFHSLPFTTPASVNKVKNLVKTLEKYGSNGKLYLAPFANAQKQIMASAPEKLRIILYRRLMARVAEKIAERAGCQALITGESIGQVASQTLENMRAVEEPVKLPIFRPLIGFDKLEIITKAKEIKTYEISIPPHEDCCARFMPQNPETKARLNEVRKAEEKMDIEGMIEEVIRRIE